MRAKRRLRHPPMQPEGPREALMQATPISAARDSLVQQAIAAMSPDERTRLQAYATERGITAEQAVVQIVSTKLAKGH